MTARTARTDDQGIDGFGHEALFYEGLDGFLGGVVPFIREGLDGGEAVLVALDPAKIHLIRDRLGGDAGRVGFVDMPELGRNPARIIPVWRQYVAECSPHGAFRGVGEPIWPGRSAAEMIECHLHESLLNLAFDDGPPWRLMCPYDVEGLDAGVIEEARRTHPFVLQGGLPRRSDAYAGARAVTEVFAAPLPEPAGSIGAVSFDIGSLRTVRWFTFDAASDVGLPARRISDLVVAVNEVATNSIRHGGGNGTLRVWLDGGTLICEIRDDGCIEGPPVGREEPSTDQLGGRGLWMVNQLCDLVQLRSSATGAAVRLHMTVSGPASA